ncbi:hypothetical protein AgCh_032776 [Apium graveolens]
MYKCISKIIASRLKRVLPGIVNNAQSAFIPGRSISDNILLAQELFRGYDRETGASRCALKIDLHKAFDTLNWDFIVAVLHKIRLPVEMISWIRAKTPAGYKHHWRCKDLNISHLLFADDVLLFARGCKDSKGGAKVAWDDICLPKDEGGLGLKNMVHWNKARLLLSYMERKEREGSWKRLAFCEARSHRAHGPAGLPAVVGIIPFPSQRLGWMRDLLHEERHLPIKVKESTEHLSGGIEYPDRIKVYAARPEQIGGVGHRSHRRRRVARQKNT